MSDVTSIIPDLPVQRATLSAGGKIGPVPQSRLELISQGNPAGAEVMLQKLLEIRGDIGGPDTARARREATVREFYGAPITYDGFSVPRRAPAESVRLVAVA